MIPDKIILSRAGLQVTLAQPGTFYRGTRFDWSGVFLDVVRDGVVYCDKWFDGVNPLKHDNVCGPSEEFFGCYGYDSAAVGEGFLKIGVGLLRRDSDGPYDWFHLYEILDAGKRSVSTSPDKAVFSHEMPGIYTYTKTVELTGPDSFRISHRLMTAEPMRILQYCHNFFTFGMDRVDCERSVEFDAPIRAIWREDNVNALNDSKKIWLRADMTPGQLCYANICCDSSVPYGFVLRSGVRAVRVTGSLPMAPSVFWSNYRVFCPEPYVELNAVPGQPLEWSTDYKLL